MKSLTSQLFWTAIYRIALILVLVLIALQLSQPVSVDLGETVSVDADVESKHIGGLHISD